MARSTLSRDYDIGRILTKAQADIEELRRRLLLLPVTTPPAGVYQAYTPTFGGTLGNGTVSGRWARIGNTVHANLFFLVGSTTTVGTTLLMGLPVTASMLPGGEAWVVVRGDAYAFVGGGANTRFAGSVVLPSSTTVGVAQNGASNASARWGASAAPGPTPATWTTGDRVYISLTYEAA